MGWFRRLKDGITTKTVNKKDTPDGSVMLMQELVQKTILN